MGQAERDLIDERFANLTSEEYRVRLNAGQGWTGEIIKRTQTTLTLKNPRAFHGAPAGFPDTCGWDSIVITPDMVGQRIAVFVGEEYKTGRLKLSRFQRLFRDRLIGDGGRFVTVRQEKPALT